MSALTGHDLRKRWIANAETLDKNGHFAQYSRKQRDEVRKKNAYTIASADAYREKHNLLTTKELKEIRRRLGMSFRAFAQYLRVSEASPKRWEAGLVQDEAMDELIRVKTDLPTARKNVIALEAHQPVSR